MSLWKPKATKDEDEGQKDADWRDNNDADNNCFNPGAAYKHNAHSRYQVSKTERTKRVAAFQATFHKLNQLKNFELSA